MMGNEMKCLPLLGTVLPLELRKEGSCTMYTAGKVNLTSYQ